MNIGLDPTESVAMYDYISKQEGDTILRVEDGLCLNGGAVLLVVAATMVASTLRMSEVGCAAEGEVISYLKESGIDKKAAIIILSIINKLKDNDSCE